MRTVVLVVVLLLAAFASGGSATAKGGPPTEWVIGARTPGCLRFYEQAAPQGHFMLLEYGGLGLCDAPDVWGR